MIDAEGGKENDLDTVGKIGKTCGMGIETERVGVMLK